MATYDLVTVSRVGAPRVHSYTDHELSPGSVVHLEGRDWLIERVEPGGESARARAVGRPARYRIRLVHPDGREELGAFRRFRPDRPTIGHGFTTIDEGRPIAWEIVDEELARDEQDEPFLDLRAERDYTEYTSPPDHELEHALARDAAGGDDIRAAVERAQAAGLAMELAALDPGEEPDWPEAERFLDALVVEELGADLLEMCGVSIAEAPRETWLATAKGRLASDLARFRADVQGAHDEIEEWGYLDGRIFASTGSQDDESDPDKGHGWMCRLLDADVLGAAGFQRVRKGEL